MEEILASIKRVIADDSRAVASPRSGRMRRSEPELVSDDSEAEEDDVLELDMPMAEEDGLISSTSAAVSRQSLAALAALRQHDDPMDPVDQAPLEAVVRDMLRPLLKQWLEQRLPDMVEEMVAREIARITGKRL